MIQCLGYSILISLKDEPETAEKLAARCSQFLSSLSKIDPLLSRWYRGTNGEQCEILHPSQASIEKLFQFYVDLREEPRNGSFLETRTNGSMEDWDNEILRADDMSIVLFAGEIDKNFILISTGETEKPDPRLVSYELSKKIMFAAVAAFDTKKATCSPTALPSGWGCPDSNKRPISASWMIVLPQHLAGQITPPPQAITQTRDDGSLFMAATDETFDVTNPVHLAVCKAMMEAIELVNKKENF